MTRDETIEAIVAVLHDAVVPGDRLEDPVGSAAAIYDQFIAPLEARIASLEQQREASIWPQSREAEAAPAAALARIAELEAERAVLMREIGKHAEARGEMEAENARLASAIRWALGEGDDFRPREPGEGGYWWRHELRDRAVLANESGPPPRSETTGQ